MGYKETKFNWSLTFTDKKILYPGKQYDSYCQNIS